MTIVINGLKWKIKFIAKKEEPEVWGYSRPSSRLIAIRNDLDLDIVRTTIIHEVVHSFLFSYGFTKIDGDTNLLFSEEQVCDFVAMNLETINKLSSKIYQYFKKVYNRK